MKHRLFSSGPALHLLLPPVSLHQVRKRRGEAIPADACMRIQPHVHSIRTHKPPRPHTKHASKQRKSIEFNELYLLSAEFVLLNEKKRARVHGTELQG
jgi:hypothetical protein